MLLVLCMRCIMNDGLNGYFYQGSHRLEKYLNIQDCLEKSLKSTGKTLKGLEKYLNFTIYRRIQHCPWRPKLV